MGINDKTNEVVHYVEKPSSFVSNHINAGVYLLSCDVFDDISMIFKERYAERGTYTVGAAHFEAIANFIFFNMNHSISCFMIGGFIT